MFNLTPTVRDLLIVNVFIYLLGMLTHWPMVEWFGYHYVGSSYYEPYQWFTYMFLHANGSHLFNNMFTLFIFGPMIEQVLGGKRFLIFYLVCGLGGGALYALVEYIDLSQLQQAYQAFMAQPTPDFFNAFVTEAGKGTYRFVPQLYTFAQEVFPSAPANAQYIDEAKAIAEQLYLAAANVPMVGASGAIFGLLLAFAYFFPNQQLFLLFIPFPIRAKYLVTAYGLFEVYSLYSQNNDNVAHLAHLGGMLFGYLLLKRWGMQRII